MIGTVSVGVLTISDRSARNERPDISGPILTDFILSSGWSVSITKIVPDEIDQISQVLIEWTDQLALNLIITTGGTGFSPRDVTPEATRLVIQKEAPGLAEAMRSASLRNTPHAMLSRSIAGIRNRTLIINLPGNPKAASENLAVLLPALPHAFQLLQDKPDSESGHQPPR
jgi:molybdopterin adenylyltransferase